MNPAAKPLTKTLVASPERQIEAAGDWAVVQQVQGGDVAAFDQLILKYRERVYAMVYHMTANREDAADFTQDAFIKAFQSIHRFQGQSAFFTWLYRIALNGALSHIRRNKLRSFFSFDKIQEDPAVAEVVAVAAHEVAQVVALPRACWRVPMQWRCPLAPPGDSLQVAAVAVAADELAQVLALLRSCWSVPTQWSCPKSPPQSWKTSPAASWGAGLYQPSQLKLLKRFFSQSVCCRASKQPGKTPGSRTLPLVSSLGGPTSGDP